jgi:hypothetical protein
MVIDHRGALPPRSLERATPAGPDIYVERLTMSGELAVYTVDPLLTAAARHNSAETGHAAWVPVEAERDPVPVTVIDPALLREAFPPKGRLRSV